MNIYFCVYVYLIADRETVLGHADTLYKIVYMSPFNTSLHALMLIYQVMDVRFINNYMSLEHYTLPSTLLFIKLLAEIISYNYKSAGATS